MLHWKDPILGEYACAEQIRCGHPALYLWPTGGPGGWDWCSSEQHSAGVVPLKLETLHPWVVALCVQAEDARVPPEILA